MSIDSLSSLASSIAYAGAARFHVQTSDATSPSGFPYFRHHDSVSALWSTKWRPPAARGIYPFMDGDVSDFDPVIDELIRQSGDDVGILLNPDTYAQAFFPAAEQLVASAEEALREGSTTEAARLFLRAAAVYRRAISFEPLYPIAARMGSRQGDVPSWRCTTGSAISSCRCPIYCRRAGSRRRRRANPNLLSAAIGYASRRGMARAALRVRARRLSHRQHAPDR